MATNSATTRRDWTANFQPLAYFKRGKDEVVINALDQGYAVEIWVQAIVGKELQTISMSRFSDSNELDEHVAETKKNYLAEGLARWKTETSNCVGRPIERAQSC